MNVEALRTERIELVDKAGEVRAHLGVGEDGNPGILLYDRTGVKRVVLGVDQDGCGLHITDSEGRIPPPIAPAARNPPQPPPAPHNSSSGSASPSAESAPSRIPHICHE